MTRASNQLGSKGEQVAVDWLRRSGMKIVARNWRFGRNEIDAVALDEDVVVFVEVKTRSGRSHGGALGAVGIAKQRAIVRAARGFLSLRRWLDRRCRFDVVAVTPGADGPEVQHVKGAFDVPD